MALGSGRLGAVSLSADVNATVYRCPITSFAVVSLNMVNRGNDDAMLYVAVSSSETPDTGDYIEYESVLEAKSVLERTGIVVGSEQYLIVRSNSDHVNAVAYGIQALQGAPRLPAYELIAAANNISESLSLSFTVNTTGVDSGTVLYWTIDNNAGDFATSSGTVTINSSTGSFSVTPRADATAEGAETFTVSIRSGSTVGTILDTTSPITINDASTFAITFTQDFTVNEGAFRTLFANNLQGIQSGVNYYWTINNITTTNADHAFGTSGIMTPNTSTQGYMQFIASNDATTEGTEQFSVQIRTGSTSGPIIGTSAPININDTSRTQTVAIALGSTTVAEGGTLNFSVNTANFPNGSSMVWRVVNGTTTAADFTGGGQVGFGGYNTTTQACTFGIGFGSSSHTLITASNGDSPETFRIQVERTTGQQLAISDVITIT